MESSGQKDQFSLAIRLGPLKLETPLIAASGTFGYGTEYSQLADIRAFGAITLKAVSIEPRAGNPYPRMVETPSGMLNCIGLENPGIEEFLKVKLPASAELNVPLIANLVGDRIEDYAHLGEILDKEDAISGIEINASCPNVDHGFLSFAADPGVLGELVKCVREVTGKPIIAKLSPNVTDIVPIAGAAVESGADILNLGNTFLGMSICVDSSESRLSRDYAGLSGRAIRPIALRIVHQVVSNVDIPVIGTGGVYDTTDALEFLIAGASAVSLGTVNFIEPSRAREICDGIREHLSKRGMELDALMGSYMGPSIKRLI